MSFSFYVKAADKAGLKAKIREELAKVIAQQPVHATDKDMVLTVADTYVDAIKRTDEASYDVTASVNGSISAATAGSDIYSLNVGVGVGFLQRDVEQTL